jgi:hypothetical protein
VFLLASRLCCLHQRMHVRCFIDISVERPRQGQRVLQCFDDCCVPWRYSPSKSSCSRLERYRTDLDIQSSPTPLEIEAAALAVSVMAQGDERIDGQRPPCRQPAGQ